MFSLVVYDKCWLMCSTVHMLLYCTRYMYFFQVRNLELLKLRFGDENLHLCDVMVKDVADSKRINARIMDDFKKDEVIHFLVDVYIIFFKFIIKEVKVEVYAVPAFFIFFTVLTSYGLSYLHVEFCE